MSNSMLFQPEHVSLLWSNPILSHSQSVANIMWEIIKSDLDSEWSPATVHSVPVSDQVSSKFWHDALVYFLILVISVPPKIVDSLSSSDMVQTEGSNVTLECVASGSPEPEVVWRREDAREITIDKNNTGRRRVSVRHCLIVYVLGYLSVSSCGMPYWLMDKKIEKLICWQNECQPHCSIIGQGTLSLDLWPSHPLLMNKEHKRSEPDK